MISEKLSSRKIFLVGLMGSGKSSIGAGLAKKMGLTFMDSDEIIESHGKSIKQIFEQEGEEYFRKVEEQVLQELLNEQGVVIATGGGMPLWHDGMRRMQSNGIVVYLKVPVVELVLRLSGNTANRPLLESEIPQLKNSIESMLVQRESTYLQADIIYENTRDQSDCVDQLASLILNNA